MKIECLGSGSSGNCYIIEFDNQDIVILEAGVPYKEIKKALGFRRTKVKGVYVTHEHGDHSQAVKAMLDDGLNVHASKGTIEALGLDYPRLHVFAPHSNKTYTVNAYDATHNANEPLMFTIVDNITKESLVFITDTSWTKFVFSGFNYYLVECNYIKSYVDETKQKGIYTNPSGHMSLETLSEMFELTDLSQCRQIILVHISDTNGNAPKMVKHIEELTNCPTDWATKGKEWTLSKDVY